MKVGDNRLIAKNTIYLYVRMLLTMLVSLYTSRVVLQQLGVEDYGIYNIIGGVVVLFSVVNGAMVLSTQRFLNYELGRNNAINAQKLFSASVNIHVLITLIFLLLAETIGLWFVNHGMNIPAGKLLSANWVYHFSVIATAVSIVRTPYNAAIIAYERMAAYAYISVVDVLCKLGIVYLLALSNNKLVDYACMVTLVTALITACYVLYCLRNFEICRYVKNLDTTHYKSLLSFSWWSLFGSVANMGASQGIAIVLNIYFGVTVNAAMGIANQVNAAVYQFVSNFQTAFNPQIIKSYAAGEMEYFKTLILNTSRYSYFLLFFISLPITICAPEILRMWLGQVPAHSVSFFRLMMAFMLIDAIQGPLWVSAQATGKIKNYQCLMSFLILLNLPISICLLHFIHVPELVLAVKVCVNILTAVARVLYLERLYGFPAIRYVKEVLWTCLMISLCSFWIPTYASIWTDGIMKVLVVTLVSLLTTSVTIYLVGLSRPEKELAKRYLYKIVRKDEKCVPD